MTDAITALSRALNNDMEQMRSVSQNMANINTQGYKREVTTVSTFQQALEANSAAPGQAGNVQNALGGVPRLEIHRDLTQGALKFSGSAFDLAINGSGFFEVQTEMGPMYTRKGGLHIDEQGRLALVTGEPVMGESGEIYLRNGPFSIDEQGVVTQDDNAMNQLKLVDFENPEELDYLGRGLWHVPPHIRPVRTVFAGAVLQGYLPAQLSEAELRDLIAEVAKDVGASSAKDMGKVMPVVMAKTKGAADGKLVNQLVRELLAG